MRACLVSLSLLGTPGALAAAPAHAPAAVPEAPSQAPKNVDREALAMFFKEPAAWKAWAEPWVQRNHSLVLTLDAFKRFAAEEDRPGVFRDLRLAASMGSVRAMLALTCTAQEALNLKEVGLKGAGGKEVDAVEALGWLNLALAFPLGPEERLEPEFQRVLTDLEEQLRKRDPKFLDQATWEKVAAWGPPSPGYDVLRKAADAGDPRAQATLGWWLLMNAPKEGPARATQMAEARALCWQAARQGHLVAQLQYASAFLMDDVQGPAEAKARVRELLTALSAAAEDGSVQAMELLATMVFGSTQDTRWAGFTLPSETQAEAWALKAAKAGVPRAMVIYAGFRFRGPRGEEGLPPQTIREARAWLALAGGREPRLQRMALALEADAGKRDMEGRGPFDERGELWEEDPKGALPGPVPRFPSQITGNR